MAWSQVSPLGRRTSREVSATVFTARTGPSASPKLPAALRQTDFPFRSPPQSITCPGNQRIVPGRCRRRMARFSPGLWRETSMPPGSRESPSLFRGRRKPKQRKSSWIRAEQSRPPSIPPQP